MQKRNNFLTKFVKKDYNNKLEEVLSKKDFSEDVKNVLLSMFYKIENGYKDYKNVKRKTFEKKEYIEKLIQIIEKDCKKITFIPINSDETEFVDKEKQEIRCFPIENRVLYCLAKIQKRNIVVKYIDENIEEAVSNVLNIGNNINIVEPLRDFNGFSWNIIEKDIENLDINLIYQNLIYVSNNKFIDKWVNNYEPLVDYFDLLQIEVEKKYGSKQAKNIITNLIRISLKMKAIQDEEFKNEIIKDANITMEQKEQMSNKTKYIEDLCKKKKKIEKDIRKLDKIINDKKKLIEEYEKRNEKLPLEKKIFSIRVLKNNLNKERESLLKQIENCNNLMRPENFIEARKLIGKKAEYLCNIENLDYKDEKIKLQKEIIKCMLISIQNIHEKEKMINLIYLYRYYNFIPLQNGKNISKASELKRSMNKLTKSLIDKAEELKIINQIAIDKEKDYKIIEKLFLSNIIRLEDINVKFAKERGKMYLIIYDEQIEDEKIEINKIYQDELKIKLGKKTKLFI